MASNIYILSNFNNYYNRIVKKEDTIQQYIDKYDVEYELSGVNFVPNDGVNTTHVFGTSLQLYSGKGDYLIEVEPGGTILSRWFIIDSVRDRAGQWTLNLHRDLVVDFYSDIVEAPTFIEKATLLPGNDLIFNSENFSVNQIKTSETLLKDKTGCPWIVGYYAKDTELAYLSGTVNLNSPDDTYDIYIDQPFDSWKFNATTNNYKTFPYDIKYRIYGNDQTAPVGFQQQNGYIDFNSSGEVIDKWWVNKSYALSFRYNWSKAAEELEVNMKPNRQNLFNEAMTYINPNSAQDSAFFRNLNNKVVKDSTGAYYVLTILPSDDVVEVVNIPAGSLFNRLSSYVAASDQITGTPNTESFKIEVRSKSYKMVETRIYKQEVTYSFDLTNKLTTEDAPYNIFAIPYGEVKLKNVGVDVVTSSAEVSMATANAIIMKMDKNLYDIQLLPYCPLDVEEDGVVDVLSDKSYNLIYGPEVDGVKPPLGFMLNIPTSRFSRNIELENPITITNTKMQSECDVYKLCSPNWASEFQFNAAKNGGVLYFNIDCEYKPFQPYIHVNPNFNALYGQDFDDARGLILSGDFSLAQISDSWQTYQIQNKNFQNQFNRQIENMEVQQNYQRITDALSIATGSVSGAASGALAGSMVAPGWGTAIGAVVGGVTSTAGGIADYAMNEKLRAEALDYTKDQFGYQLQNIKALPYTLTKVSAFNNNNKIYPVLEYYTCTLKEKEALANKIAWNGMTVMAIGRINDYIGNSWSYTYVDETGTTRTITSKGYIKGKIIRLDNIGEDYHIINAISGELDKGVYIE